jgi:hypothetical protein
MQSKLAAFTHKETFMPKSTRPAHTIRRPKDPFDPALEAPVVLTPDQLEAVVGSLGLQFATASEGGGGGTTTGAIMPIKAGSILKF